MTDKVLEAPYGDVTLVELPDTDTNSKVDVEAVKRKQEDKRQAVMHEKQESEKKLKARGREVSSQLESVCEQANSKIDDMEYQ
jgi:hypothetical protein